MDLIDFEMSGADRLEVKRLQEREAEIERNIEALNDELRTVTTKIFYLRYPECNPKNIILK